MFVTPARFMTEAYRLLYYVTRSHFKLTASLADSYCYLQGARQAAAGMRDALSAAAHGDFATWYADERYFGVGALSTEIDATLATLPAAPCAPRLEA